jgi:hypothetical protein
MIDRLIQTFIPLTSASMGAVYCAPLVGLVTLLSVNEIS